ncbi:hypothetical protein B0H14DRAFT_3546723 [Mycena olivaceomarginata]|nr:hypothetical protein B0H14DRAFT_3546723 [Mycena olivaceomarginata]
MGDGRCPEHSFDYSELEPTGAGDSIEEQKISFHIATKDERAKLEEKYPIGNYANFPNHHVYLDTTIGFYYEPNATRLGVWASAMARGFVTENEPPQSKFFDANQRIKAVPPVSATPALPAPAPANATAAACLPGASLSVSDLIVASFLSQGGVRELAALLNPGASAPPPPPNPARTLHSAPPSSIKRHSVTVEQFCEVYGLPEKDRILLEEVDFCPGDRTDSELHDELKKAGFTFFSWQRIHGANLRHR